MNVFFTPFILRKKISAIRFVSIQMYNQSTLLWVLITELQWRANPYPMLKRETKPMGLLIC